MASPFRHPVKTAKGIAAFAKKHPKLAAGIGIGIGGLGVGVGGLGLLGVAAITHPLLTMAGIGGLGAAGMYGAYRLGKRLLGSGRAERELFERGAVPRTAGWSEGWSEGWNADKMRRIMLEGKGHGKPISAGNEIENMMATLGMDTPKYKYNPWKEGNIPITGEEILASQRLTAKKYTQAEMKGILESYKNVTDMARGPTIKVDESLGGKLEREYAQAKFEELARKQGGETKVGAEAVARAANANATTHVTGTKISNQTTGTIIDLVDEIKGKKYVKPSLSRGVNEERVLGWFKNAKPARKEKSIAEIMVDKYGHKKLSDIPEEYKKYHPYSNSLTKYENIASKRKEWDSLANLLKGKSSEDVAKIKEKLLEAEVKNYLASTVGNKKGVIEMNTARIPNLKDVKKLGQSILGHIPEGKAKRILGTDIVRGVKGKVKYDDLRERVRDLVGLGSRYEGVSKVEKLIRESEKIRVPIGGGRFIERPRYAARTVGGREFEDLIESDILNSGGKGSTKELWASHRPIATEFYGAGGVWSAEAGKKIENAQMMVIDIKKILEKHPNLVAELSSEYHAGPNTMAYHNSLTVPSRRKSPFKFDKHPDYNYVLRNLNEDAYSKAKEVYKGKIKPKYFGEISDLAAAASGEMPRISLRDVLVGFLDFGTGKYSKASTLGKRKPWFPEFATGGLVTGGTPGRDSIPAMLSPGEYVVNASSTAKYGELLKSINSKGFTGFASGGPVGVNASGISVPVDASSAAQELSSSLSDVASIFKEAISSAVGNISVSLDSDSVRSLSRGSVGADTTNVLESLAREVRETRGGVDKLRDDAVFSSVSINNTLEEQHVKTTMKMNQVNDNITDMKSTLVETAGKTNLAIRLGSTKR
jgi:hypothetical protein